MVALLAIAAAQAQQVQLEVEPTTLGQGQAGTARVTIVSTWPKGAQPSPRPPELRAPEGLRAVYAGQSQQYSVRNRVRTQVNQFEYQLTGLRTGDWKLGPVDVSFTDGSTLQSNPVTVKVVPRDSLQQNKFDVSASFSDTDVWEGQVLLYEFRFQTTTDVVAVEWNHPRFDGVRQTQEGRPDVNRYMVEDPDGHITVEEGVVPLIATGTGHRDQGPAMAIIKTPTGPRRGLRLLQRVHVDQVVTDPIEIDVRPLPEAPPGFSGLVGEFKVDSKVGTTRGTVGQSIPWTVTIRGNGALEGYALPPYEAERVSIYENEANIAARVNDGAFEALARFERVLVPTEAGTLKLPALELVTFSTARGRYVTHRVDLPTIEVSPGREGEGEITSFATPVEEGEPLPEGERGPVPRGIIRTGAATALPTGAWLPWLLALFVLPGLGSLGWDAARTARRWWRARTTVPEATQTPADRLAAAPASGPERWAALEEALRQAKQESAEELPEVDTLLERVGRMRFAPGTHDPDLNDDVVRAIRSLS